MKYISSLNYFVENVANACKFLCDNFDFQIENENKDENAILVTNGVLIIRISDSKNRATSTLFLDYLVDDLESTQKKLTKAGFKTLVDKSVVSQFREEIQMAGLYGLNIIIYKLYTIDEIGICLELETTLDWDDDAIAVTQDLMKEVPLNFRESAKAKVVEEAEAIAITDGDTIVGFNLAVKSVINTTPAFREEELIIKLKELKISPQLFESK